MRLRAEIEAEMRPLIAKIMAGEASDHEKGRLDQLLILRSKRMTSPVWDEIDARLKARQR